MRAVLNVFMGHLLQIVDRMAAKRFASYRRAVCGERHARVNRTLRSAGTPLPFCNAAAFSMRVYGASYDRAGEQAREL